MDHEPPEQDRIDHVDAVIPGLMRKIGLESPHWVEKLEGAWPDIVGVAVAKHTRPGRMENAKLTVFVDSSVWLSELSRYGRREILAKLQERFGARRIRNLSLQLDPGD